MFQDFENDFICEIGQDDFNKLSPILDLVFENDFEDFEKDNIVISCSREKIHQLQENVCVNISCDDYEVELLFENGINNGTRLNDYQINPVSSFCNELREVSFITGIELDIDKMDVWSFVTGKKYSIEKAQILLNNNMDEIMDNIRKQNYDNYVTGGGTTNTDNYYDSKKRKLNDIGLFCKIKYKTEIVPTNFV